MTRSRMLAALAFLLLVGVTLGHQVNAQSVDEILASGELKTAFNPVVLDYLLEEGADALPEEQRKQAIDQLVTALKQDIDITPEEQRAAAMAAAGAGIAQLFGGTAGELGGAAQGATYQIWKGWVDSAFTLQRAGYNDGANAFFEKCIAIYPYSDLKGRCAIGLAAGKPDEAFDRVVALTETPDTGVVSSALRILGQLAGSDGFPEAKRNQAIDLITQYTKGMKKASYGVAACHGLVATGDPRVVPVLQPLAKGMMNSDIFPCARRGLLMTFADGSVVPLLEKDLKGGTFSTVEPADRLFSVGLLMEAGENSGFQWAREQFATKPKKGFGKLMSSEKEVDYKPSLVTILVRVGDDRSLALLQEAMTLSQGSSWLTTWIAVGLLELDDTTHLALAKAALGNPDWDFTAVRISTALAKHGDYAGIPALATLYDKAARGVDPGKATLAFLAGEGGYGESEGNRLLRLKHQIANALGTIDHADGVPLLIKMLGDKEHSVRASAAYALARMNDPAALSGLAQAVTVDFGKMGDQSRNPTVHAQMVRSAAGSASADAGVVFTAGKTSPFASVRFLAAVASSGS